MNGVIMLWERALGISMGSNVTFSLLEILQCNYFSPPQSGLWIGEVYILDIAGGAVIFLRIWAGYFAISLASSCALTISSPLFFFFLAVLLVYLPLRYGGILKKEIPKKIARLCSCFCTIDLSLSPPPSLPLLFSF
jgi:hypothetical protein